jgi:hypothetical protein
MQASRVVIAKDRYAAVRPRDRRRVAAGSTKAFRDRLGQLHPLAAKKKRGAEYDRGAEKLPPRGVE